MHPEDPELLRAKIDADIITGDDGFRVYIPQDGTLYSSPVLRMIADRLDELNLAWATQIEHMHEEYLRVCDPCAEPHEQYTVGVARLNDQQVLCELCGKEIPGKVGTYSSLATIRNPHYVEPSFPTLSEDRVWRQEKKREQ